MYLRTQKWRRERNTQANIRHIRKEEFAFLTDSLNGTVYAFCQIWCIVFFCQFMVSQQRQPPFRGFTHVHARGENYSAFFFENFKEFMFFSFLKSHCNARHNVKVTFLGGGRYGNSYKNMCKTNIT